MKYKKKPIIVEATQWFKNGDHPKDGNETFISPSDGKEYRCEGKVVRYYRNPGVPGEAYCHYCGYTYHAHGWMEDYLSDYGNDVCPGDWIVSDPDDPGVYQVWKPKAFEMNFELAEPCNDSECSGCNRDYPSLCDGTHKNPLGTDSKACNCANCGGIDMDQMYPSDDDIGLAEPQCMASCCATSDGWKAPDCDIIEDGFGSAWGAWCPECKQKSMEVVRPGKVQCGYCG